ncbi:MAG: YciE/YciF ferroxidase family protein [Armatimonadota bacterium]
MATMTKSINTMEDLLHLELQELYSIEQQVIEAMPRLAKMASSQELRADMQEHLEQTKQQKQRLEHIFELLDLRPEAHEVKAFGVMLQEAEQMLQSIQDEDVRDAALIGAAQKVEHLEMAGYGTARSHALEADLDDIAEILQQTLDEEGETDELLTEAAESDINVKAAHRE